MSTSIGKWAAQASLDASGFTSGAKAIADGANRAKAQVDSSFGGMGRSVTAFMGRMTGGGFGVSAAMSIPAALGLGSLSSIGSHLNQTLEEQLELGHLNDQLGTSIEFLSTLQTVAMESGLAAEQFGGAMEFLNRQIGAAALGSTEAQAAFAALGLDWRNLRGQSFETTFRQIAEALSQVENRAERSRLAALLGGRGNAGNLLRMVNDLDARMADARGRGAFTSAEDMARFQQLDDSIDRFTTEWRNLWREFLSNTAPAISAFFDGIVNRWREFREQRDRLRFGSMNFGQVAGEDIAENGIGAGSLWSGFAASLGAAFGGPAPPTPAPTPPPAPGPGLAGFLPEGMLDAFREFGATAMTVSAALGFGSSAMAQFARDLQQQEGAIGLSGNALRLYQLRQAATTEAEHDAIDALTEQARAVDEARERWDEFTSDIAEAARVFDQTRTPLETFRAEMDRLQRLQAGAGLNERGADTFDRASAEAFERLAATIPERRLPGAIEQGSAESLSLVNRARIEPSTNAMERVRQIMEAAQARDDARNAYLREISEAIRELAPPEEVNID